MGGMAAFIPSRRDAEVNGVALAKVKEDKDREAKSGFDGTWVAHPGMVQLALDAFNRLMPTPNQIERKRDDVNVSAKDLLDFGPSEPITEQGLRVNVSVHRSPSRVSVPRAASSIWPPQSSMSSRCASSASRRPAQAAR